MRRPARAHFGSKPRGGSGLGNQTYANGNNIYLTCQSLHCNLPEFNGLVRTCNDGTMFGAGVVHEKRAVVPGSAKPSGNLLTEMF